MRAKLILVLLAVLFSLPALAQPAAKAYAPEDLNALTQPEQVRVLEKQYEELSGGRALPEDQLEFYLEQIPRGWSYAQITQDMTQSLRDRVDGVTYPDRLPPPARPGTTPVTRPGQGWGTPGYSHQFPGRGQEIRCSSRGRRYAECATGFRNPPRLSEQISTTRCVEGRNWGHRPGVIWVAQGCRAVFIEDAPRVGELPEMRCSSTRGYRECNVAFRGPAELLRQTSGSSLCVEGRTWGQRPGLIWVDRGCGGVFAEAYSPSGGFYDADEHAGYTVDCRSLDGHYAICSWSRQFGEPVLIQQFSSDACIEGVTWGHSPRRGLWVDRGCRARFGSRGR